MTICAFCKHVKILPGDKAAWWKWSCQLHPLPQWENPVTGIFAADPPFQLCKKLNFGECETFEEGPSVVNPREPDDGIHS